MEIIDAQIHQPAPRLEGWEEGSEAAWRVAIEIALASMDAAGVDRAVISMSNNPEWLRFAVTQTDRLASTPSWLDEDAPDLEEQLAELMTKPGVLGYRQLLNYPDARREKFKAGGYDRLFAACEKRNVPLMVLVSGEPMLAAPIARRHPDLSLIIDHVGMNQPPVLQEADSPPFKQLPQLIELAQFDNVTVKLSGAPTLTAEPYPFMDLWPHLHQILEAFGADRLMWGTDIQRVNGRVARNTWEVDFVGRHSYAEAVGFLRDTDQISQSEKEQIFAGTLRRVLGWTANA